MRGLHPCRSFSRGPTRGSSCTRAATRRPWSRGWRDWAQSHGKRLIAAEQDAARLPGGVELVPEPLLAERSDALVALGGDGTMLGALRLVAHRPVPVLGVNLGTRGFLVEVQPAELDEALHRLDPRGDYTIEEHSAALLADGAAEAMAFNDIALASVPGEGCGAGVAVA